MKDLVAVAEYGLKPKCYIFQCPSKKLFAQFEMDTTLKAIGMAFSRDGKYLVILGGLPDFKISIFNLEEQKLIPMPETTFKSKEDILSVSFNPRSKNEFCILTPSFIHFYKLLPAFQVVPAGEMDESEGGPYNTLEDAYRLDLREFSVADIDAGDHDGPLHMTSLKWDPFGRIHLCTNTNKLFQINVTPRENRKEEALVKKDPKPKQEFELTLDSVPMTTLLTQKHMIIFKENGYVSWHRVEVPRQVDENIDDKIEFDMKIGEEKKYNFAEQLGDSGAPAQFAYYSKKFARMIIGTSNGVLAVLPIQAEKFDDGDGQEEEDENNQKKQQILQDPLQIMGRFHVEKINGIRELGISTQFVTISHDETFAIWEATTGKQLSNRIFISQPTALDVSKDGKVVFIGSVRGVFRAYDVTNRKNPRLIQQLRFFNENEPLTSIVCSPNGNLMVLASSKSNKIWFMSQKSVEKFQIYGFANANGHVVSCSFGGFEGVQYVLCVLNNGLVQAFKCPSKVKQDKMKAFSEEEVKAYVRKVDPKTEHVIATPNKEAAWFVSGHDYYLKKYTVFPSEPYSKINWDTPAIRAEFLIESHALETTAFCFSNQHDLFVSGGKDGKLLVRTITDMMSKHAHNNISFEVQTHSVLRGGVSALCMSNLGQFVYVCGQDGSIFIEALKQGEHYPRNEVNDAQDGAAEVAKMETVYDVDAEDIKFVIDIIQEEANRTNDAEKRKFKDGIMTELEIISKNLRKLLEANDNVQDIEKLQREEFVVDVERQQQFLDDGEHVCSQIRQDAEKQTLQLQLLREIVQKNTWDTMEVQSKACKSIMKDTTLWNFSIRKRRPEEERLFKQIVIQRKIEMLERARRNEQSLKEALDETDFSQALKTETNKEKMIQVPVEAKEEYLMNRLRGKPQFIDDDAILKVQEAIDKEREKREAERAKLKNAGANIMHDGTSKEKPILTITKGRLGQKTKKKDDDAEARERAANQRQTVELKGMEETHWKVSLLEAFKKVQNEDLRKTFENMNPYDLLYSAFELYTGKRKRTQIEILKAVVFELKRDFNKEFLQLEIKKAECRDNIKEKNEIIKELIQNLGENEVVQEVTSHPDEDPEHIMRVDESEITVERVLTKEERAIKEEEERRIREREEALKGDNVQQRGLKTMMGGNELNLKKDKNKAEITLELPEHLKQKKPEQYNEEEKQQFDDLVKKFEEMKDKQKKAWKQDMHKIKQEVMAIKTRFEEELLNLFKKRLFYEARIYEQELYIIRLVIMLSDVKQTGENIVKSSTEVQKLEEEFHKKNELFQQVQDELVTREQAHRTDQGLSAIEGEAGRYAQEQQLGKGKILEFVKKGKSGAKLTLSIQDMAKLSEHIVPLDPFMGIDKLEVEAEKKKREQVEDYQYQRDKPGEVTEEQFDTIVEFRHKRVELAEIKSQNEKKLNNLKDYKHFLEEGKNTVADQRENAEAEALKWQEHEKKLKFNYEVMVYLRQGQVEVTQQPVTTDYKDAILIDQNVIKKENLAIRQYGDRKIMLMTKILKGKTDLNKMELKLQKLELLTKDFLERAKDVQLYRVTKQTQEIIQGKHMKRDEDDKKRLENQIAQLEKNTAARIAAIEKIKAKLRREIKEKRAENEQLETKARALKQQVDDRQSIIQLRTEKAEDTSDPKKKCAEIAQQRKLMEVIQQQSEEMMFLKDELDRLRARTFPSFAHLQKPEYPDER